ncbi:hypothetical protein [Bradyrhizobium sp. 160]|uniref:hypothetical protein n=2 Tax=Bradyrhizobium TaxID=374 RepID=UPI001FFBBD6C|nr:hypothetical protein [Bradyrhizobium sp. 160]
MPIHNVYWPIIPVGRVALARFGRLTLLIIPITSLHNGNEMVAATRELPTSGYAIEVDGRFKAEFTTRDGAKAAGEELKKRFPLLQIRIYDAQTHAREEI